MATAAKQTAAKQEPKPRKQREKVNPDESKRQRFIRLGNNRVNKVLVGIDRISNLSSPAYEYTAADVEKMFVTLRKAIDAAETRFVRSDREDFTLS